MNLSKRVFGMQASPIRRLIPFAEEAKARGTGVYFLNIGQPDIPTPPVFMESIRNYKEEVVPYSHSAGLIELRRAFSNYYERWQAEIKPEEIIITSGGSEAVIFAVAAVADPEEEIIVIEPFYANYKGFAGMVNVRLTPVAANPEEGYRVPDEKTFEKVINPKTRAILFSNPCNPTGAVYSKEEVLRILRIAEKYDLMVIVDEVYREFVFDGLQPFSALEFPEYRDRIILIDSVSKRYSSCGARVGVFATKNKEVYAQVMKMAQARLSPPTMAQIGTLGLLSLGEDYIYSVRDEYKLRRDKVYEELSRIPGLAFKKPQGAFYLSVKLPIDNSEKFVKWMLSDFSLEGYTTMVSPLDGFYATPGAGEQEIRIAYVVNAEKIKKACEVFRVGLEEYIRIQRM
ncbi:MAG TPA: pyridoxal phosphate-dependent aminotransferase [Thermotogota bacterium]|nr:pyridoxal phosphate-dependent aminotransferase [Thermotogota bacterium]HNT95569.1 pyridoxal phosphate-dependent aminotransferase [Thermotogota bacterium]HOZ11929.1 pyridoxal phosphate-dependent aminotransferase [Thermotogota bacterium]HPB86947.1 pyridoxal phosphate-dependent aminotransferase [Thermotogota bacterium]HPH10289.1 pyridoxal phosphate-dependent aminotransferase [Thermotogota bacterium]